MEKTMESRLATDIMDAVNTIGFKPQKFAELMCCQHRTL